VKETDFLFPENVFGGTGGGVELIFCWETEAGEAVSLVAVTVDLLGLEADFLGFFAGLADGGGVVLCSTLFSVGIFLFLFSGLARPSFIMAGSFLAFFSLSPSFFHAGTCFSTVWTADDIMLTERDRPVL